MGGLQKVEFKSHEVTGHLEKFSRVTSGFYFIGDIFCFQTHVKMLNVVLMQNV